MSNSPPLVLPPPLVPLMQMPREKHPGGKGIGLQAAAAAGFSIPPTLVIPVSWTCGILADTQLRNLLDDESFRDDGMTPIRERLDHLLPPQSVWKSLCENLEPAFRDAPLAIRSSSFQEDQPEASFAGQFITRTQVPPEGQAMRQAVLEILANVGHPALRRYSRKAGLDVRQLQMAILVQPMIQGTHAGVAFSVDPRTGDPPALIEAVAGGNQDLLAGKAAPMTNPLPAALTTRLEQALDRLSSHLGGPVDIEWVWTGVDLVVLQVRPVTGLAERLPSGITWTRTLTAERYPLPLSPLGWTNLREVFDGGVRAFADFMGFPIDRKEQLATSYNGWILANAEAFDFRKTFRLTLTRQEQIRLLKVVVPELWRRGNVFSSIRRLKRWLEDPGKARTRLGDSLGTAPCLVACEALGLYLKRQSDAVSTAWPTILEDFQREIREAERALDLSRTWQEILAVGDGLRQTMIRFIKPDLVIFAIKEITAQAIQDLARLAGMPHPEHLPPHLGRGVGTGSSFDLPRVLQQLRQVMRTSHGGPIPADPRALTEEAQDLLSGFLTQYGHLTTSWDIRFPTWGEDPTSILRLLREESARGNPDDDNPGQELPHEGERGTRGQDPPSSGRPAHGKNPPRRPPVATPPPEGTFEGAGGRGGGAGMAGTAFFSQEAAFWKALRPFSRENEFARNLVQTLRTFMYLDEEHHFHTGRIFPLTRRLVRQIGEILTQRQILENPGDVFWLTDREIRNLLAAREPGSRAGLVRTRRLSWEVACRKGPPEIAQLPPVPAGTMVLQGLGVSPGQVEGPVCKAATIEDLHGLRGNGILVIRSPDPTFTLAFDRISGIAAETGSMLSHGAVAAREYGLPAVFAIGGLWDRVSTGTIVRLDGLQGSLHILKEADHGED